MAGLSLREDWLKLSKQFGQVHAQRSPKNVLVHKIVAVNEPMAHADDLPPRDLRKLVLNLRWHLAGRLANKLHEVREPSRSTSSLSRSDRSLLRVSSTALRAKSRMCRSRTSGSCRDILNLSLGQDLIAEIFAERVRGVQFDLTVAEEERQFLLHIVELEQTNPRRRLKFHQHVDVTAGAEVRAQYGTEKRKLADSAPLAKSCDLGRWN